MIAYSTPKGPALFFTGFTKNNSGMHYNREAPSIFPPPPGWGRSAAGLVQNTNGGDPQNDTKEPLRQDSGLNPDEVRMSAGQSPDEVRVEVKVEVEKKTTTTACETIRTDGEDSEKPSGGGSFPPPKKPDGWKEVVYLYESNIGTFTLTSSEMVQAAVVDYGAVLVADAIKESVRQNVKKWSYVDGILKRWHANGRDGPKVKDVLRKPPREITIYNQYTGQHEKRIVS